jgi:hypothetical protein
VKGGTGVLDRNHRRTHTTEQDTVACCGVSDLHLCRADGILRKVVEGMLICYTETV